MTSIEKLYAAIERLENAEDDDVTGAIGVPPSLVQAALPFVFDKIPTDAAELDEFLTQVGDFCHALRSDNYAPIV